MSTTRVFNIHSAEDVRRIEQVPFEQALPFTNTYDLIVQSAQKYQDKAAITFMVRPVPGECDITWSFNELLKKVNQMANLLHSFGVQSQDAVAITLPGCPEYHAALWGAEAAGIASPINPLLSEAKQIELMNVAKAKVLVTYGGVGDSNFWQKALNIQDKVPTLEKILVVAPYDEPNCVEQYTGRIMDFVTALNSQVSDRLISQRQFHPTDIAAYIHTGGTTGSPKMAKHSHQGQVFSAWSYVTMQSFSEYDRLISGYPMFHSAGILPAGLAIILSGGQFILPTTMLFRNKAVIENYWKIVDFYKLTAINGAPTILSMLLNKPTEGYDLSHVVACRTGTAAVPAELVTQFRKTFNLQIQESYGMTEMTALSAMVPPLTTADAGCSGYTIPYGRFKIVKLNEDGSPSEQEVEIGQSGVILYKGPNVFPGYIDEKATKEIFTHDGWLISGDLGFQDKREMIHITGRAKDLIIRSGHNIDPKMIEDAISHHPDVVLAAAVGAPDDYAGELPVLFVTLKDGASATADELMDYVTRHVDEAPARPKSITILKEMPLTNVGKIFKPELRLLATKKILSNRVEKVLSAQGYQCDYLISAELDAKGRVLTQIDLHHSFAFKDVVKDQLMKDLNKMPMILTVS